MARQSVEQSLFASDRRWEPRGCTGDARSLPGLGGCTGVGAGGDARVDKEPQPSHNSRGAARSVGFGAVIKRSPEAATTGRRRAAGNGRGVGVLVSRRSSGSGSPIGGPAVGSTSRRRFASALSPERPALAGRGVHGGRTARLPWHGGHGRRRGRRGAARGRPWASGQAGHPERRCLSPRPTRSAARPSALSTGSGSREARRPAGGGLGTDSASRPVVPPAGAEVVPAGTADRGDALGGVLKERSASQEHFIDLCRLLGEPTPADADPTGETYCFERGARRAAGGDGWADVWKRHHLRLAIQGAARQPSNPGRPLADIGVKMRDIQTIVGTWRLTGAGGGLGHTADAAPREVRVLSRGRARSGGDRTTGQ